MHFCSDELAAIVNALQTSPTVYWHWFAAWLRAVRSRLSRRSTAVD